MKDLNERQLRLIQLLSDGEFHSGEQIGQELGISRAAISQQIKVIRQLGLDIYSLTGRGYCLKTPFQMMTPAKIAEKVPEAPVHVQPLITSTNQVMMSELNRWQRGECLLAEMQTAGRGRRGRQWFSPFGSQYIMSMFWQLEAGPAAAMGLSLAIGVSVVKSLEAMGYQSLGLKWPNDVYMEHRKLAGILVEMAATVGGACQLVIGTGVNLQLPEEIIAAMDQPCAHLAEQNIAIDRNELCARMIRGLRDTLALFERSGLEPFLADWNRLDIFMEQPVKVMLGEQLIYGTYKGIDTQGNMLLLTSEGALQQFVGGEVSLRPA